MFLFLSLRAKRGNPKNQKMDCHALLAMTVLWFTVFHTWCGIPRKTTTISNGDCGQAGNNGNKQSKCFTGNIVDCLKEGRMQYAPTRP